MPSPGPRYGPGSPGLIRPIPNLSSPELGIIFFLPPAPSFPYWGGPVLRLQCAGLWFLRCSRQSRGEESNPARPAQEFRDTGSWPVFPTAEPGVPEQNSEPAQFNQVRQWSFRAASHRGSEDPAAAVTLFIKMIENVFLNRLEGPRLNHTAVLALMSRLQVPQLLVHGCFPIEVCFYCP